MFELVPVNTEEQLHILSELADEIWHECFPGIISSEQIDYMVDRFQSFNAMKRQISDEGYQYYFIYDGNSIAGYTAFCFPESENIMFLSKLYLHKSFRGRGLASKAIDRLASVCRSCGAERIRLTVNIHNRHAIEIYRRKGFVIAYDQKADIGSGFFMDDHVMELSV